MKSKFLKIAGLVLFVCLSANSAFSACEDYCCGLKTDAECRQLGWNDCSSACSKCTGMYPQYNNGQAANPQCSVSIKSALSNYCVNCSSSITSERLPIYRSNITGKPTKCYCDYTKGLIYNKSSITCDYCTGTSVATNYSLECQPIYCPANTYLTKVSTSEYGQCPKNSVLSKRIDASVTYNP